MIQEVELPELLDPSSIAANAAIAIESPVAQADEDSAAIHADNLDLEEIDTANLLAPKDEEVEEEEGQATSPPPPSASVYYVIDAEQDSYDNNRKGNRHEPQRQIRWLIVAGTCVFSILVATIASMVIWQLWMRSQQQHNPCVEPTTDTPLLIISFDGFRADYFDMVDTPNFARVWQRGVRARSMVPVFPSKTFPNHYTIVTGLYPESHGIVSNKMYDPVFDETFSLSNIAAVTDGKWWSGEPIWVTLAKHGQRSGVYFWPGSEAEIAGHRPTYWERFRTVDPHIRVDTVISWLEKPKTERPSFLALYFDEVDHAGHSYGPYSQQVKDAVRSVDATLGYLLDQLDERSLTQNMNIMLVSDHGMANTTADRVIYLDDYIADPPISSLKVVEYSPVLGIIPLNASHTEFVDSAYDKLANATPLMPIFKRSQVPERFHYRNNRRIPNLIGVAEDCYTITGNRKNKVSPGGAHGYDPLLPSMHAIFVAAGPAFKTSDSDGSEDGIVVPSFDNIHLYELMSHLLDVTPAPNNGTLSAVKHLLRNPDC